MADRVDRVPGRLASRRAFLGAVGLAAGSVGLEACSVKSAGQTPASEAGSSADIGTPTTQFPLERWNADAAAGAKPPLPARVAFLNPIGGISANAGFDAAFRAAADDSKLQLIEANPGTSSANSITQAKQMIARGVVGFYDFQAYPEMQTVNLSAMKQGVGVVQVNQGPVTSSLYSVQYEGGFKLGQFVAKYVKTKLGGEAKIAFLSQDFNKSLQQRGVGFKDAIAQAGIQHMLVSYVTPPATPGGTQSAGNQLMTSLLQQHPDINVAAAAGDDLAFGAISALTAAGRSGAKYMACGIDGGNQALQTVQAQNSIFKATVGVNFNFAGYCPGRMLGRWAQGLTIPQVQVFNYFTIDSPGVAAKFIRDSSSSELGRVFDNLVNGDDTYVTPLGTVSYAKRNEYYDGDMVLKLPKLNFIPNAK